MIAWRSRGDNMHVRSNIFNLVSSLIAIPPRSPSPAHRVKQVCRDMASHVSSSGLRLGGASDDTASPLTQGEAPHFNNSGHAQVPPDSGRNVPISPDRFFLQAGLAVHPFVANRLYAALFVTSSTSLQLPGLETTALLS
jgi:hypothetical protein